MPGLPLPSSRGVRFLRQCAPLADQADDVLSALRETPPRISPKYFYDDTGSGLFELITRLDEYYPTRTERALYQRYADDMAEACGTGRVVIEPGAGSCEKIRLLLDALRPSCYVPTDISGDFLRDSAHGLASEYPWLQITAVQSDFNAGMSLPEGIPRAHRTLFYPGSTLGNFQPLQAQRFLRQAARLVGPQGNLLIGLDMHKSTEVLQAAYDDTAGVTARFNLNALTHLNRVFDGDFDIRRFRHVARYNERDRRIEMYLESSTDQQCTLAGSTLTFRQGERILTEYSHKYTRDSVATLAASAGLEIAHCWLDDRDWFGVFLLVPTAGPRG